MTTILPTWDTHKHYTYNRPSIYHLKYFLGDLEWILDLKLSNQITTAFQVHCGKKGGNHHRSISSALRKERVGTMFPYLIVKLIRKPI